MEKNEKDLICPVQKLKEDKKVLSFEEWYKDITTVEKIDAEYSNIVGSVRDLHILEKVYNLIKDTDFINYIEVYKVKDSYNIIQLYEYRLVDLSFIRNTINIFNRMAIYHQNKGNIFDDMIIDVINTFNVYEMYGDNWKDEAKYFTKFSAKEYYKDILEFLFSEIFDGEFTMNEIIEKYNSVLENTYYRDLFITNIDDIKIIACTDKDILENIS